MKFLTIFTLVIIGMATSSCGKSPPAEVAEVLVEDSSSLQPSPIPPTTSIEYQCEGKRKCSQMTSCEEATFYLQNCPATIMDGDNDGVPCENELCEENGKSSYPPVAYSPSNPDTGKGFSYTYGTVEPYTESSSSSSSDFLGATETSASRCAGKTWCSQMSSCAEAMFYLQNCPGTKMDGDNDGIPCEDRCGH